MAFLTAEQIEEVEQTFERFLKARKQRQTPERFAILREVYQIEEHFDADSLYIRLRQNGVGVSRATVYNTLELLTECQLVARHQFGNNKARYERAFSYWQHDHLICMECNAIFEFCDPRLQSVQEMVEEVFGFAVERHALHMYGHCKNEDCPNREEKSAAPSQEV